MLIKHIRIEHFRGIRQVDIELSETTILIGPNNAGKSAILDAVRIALTIPGVSLNLAEPGCIGVANPIPERIEGLGIFERIREYTSGQFVEQQGSSFRESLHRLASAIYESLGAERIGDSGGRPSTSIHSAKSIYTLGSCGRLSNPPSANLRPILTD